MLVTGADEARIGALVKKVVSRGLSLTGCCTGRGADIGADTRRRIGRYLAANTNCAIRVAASSCIAGIACE